jgi:3-hydroxybutyryl-CoA dehydrogenase
MTRPSPSRSRFRRVLVVGAGTMGRGISALTASRGFETFLFDADPDALHEGREAVHKSWEKAQAKGKLAPEEVESARHRLHGLNRLAEAASVDLAIEAIPEDLDLKKMLFEELDSLCQEKAVLATNTSSLSVTRIGAATRRPDRVVGLHFFNPVSSMPLVEIVRGKKTGDAVVAAAEAFVGSLGKQSILVNDVPGFATSRLGLALGLEAMRMVEEGVASPEDIDRAMEAGYGHSLGPLKTSDLVGLDVRLAIAETLSTELSEERFRPPELLRRLVSDGRTGKKAGRGFYRWDGDVPVSAALPASDREKASARAKDRPRG